MKIQITPVLQRSISKVFPGNTSRLLAEGSFLLLTGMLAMFLHARLRIPMHLPGRQGLLFMLLLTGASLLSGMRFSSLLATTGAALYMLSGVGGFDDPFMPVHYLILGFVLDLQLNTSSRLNASWFIALAGGLSYSVIPLSRALIMLLTGIPTPSLVNGVLFPWFMHFLFGFSGSLIAVMAVKSLPQGK